MLPWRPRLREPSWDLPDLSSAVPDDDSLFAGIALAVAVAVALPIVLVLVFFSLELALVLALVPLLMVGQVLGLLPWVLVLRSGGDKQYVEVRGTRAMLAQRRQLRAMRVS